MRELVRVVAVIALVVVAAAVATPKGRSPLALRGVLAVLKRDGRGLSVGEAKPISPLKRLFAFVLVLLAALLAII